MRGRRAGGKRRQPRAVASHRAVATPSPACGAVFRAQRPTLGNGTLDDRAPLGRRGPAIYPLDSSRSWKTLRTTPCMVCLQK